MSDEAAAKHGADAKGQNVFEIYRLAAVPDKTVKGNRPANTVLAPGC